MSVRWIIPLVLGGALGVGGAIGRLSDPSGASLSHELDRASADPAAGTEHGTELWYFFRLSDCRVRSPQIHVLDALRTEGRVRVRGVLLDPPLDPTAAAQVVRAFGAGFPIQPDLRGRWEAALTAAGYAPPVYVVRRKRRIVGVLSENTAVWQALRMEDPEVELATAAGTAGVHDEEQVAGKRHFLGDSLILVRSVTTTERGTLVNPLLLAATATRLYVLDFGDRTLKAFTPEGSLLWTYGQASHHDLTFSSPQQISTDAAGDAVIFDAPTGLLSVVNADGRLRDTVRVRASVQRVVVDRQGDWGFDAMGGGIAGYRLDATGRVQGTLLLNEQFRKIPPIARATIALALPASDTVVTAFQNSDYLAFWSPGVDAPRLVHGVEPTPFPTVLSWRAPDGYTHERLSPSAADGAMALTANAHDVFVLYGGRSAYQYRVIDEYARADGHYVGSLVLPRRTAALAWVAHGFVTVSGKPHPALDIWRRLPKERHRAGRRSP